MVAPRRVALARRARRRHSVQVSAHLRYFIRKKQQEDPVWRRLHIVFSGHEVA